ARRHARWHRVEVRARARRADDHAVLGRLRRGAVGGERVVVHVHRLGVEVHPLVGVVDVAVEQLVADVDETHAVGSMPPRSSTESAGFVSALDHIVRTLRITTWFESDTLSEKPGVSSTVRFSIVSPPPSWKSRIVLRGPWPRIVTPSFGEPVLPAITSV